jgi:subtilisin family serine protease/MFS family permease
MRGVPLVRLMAATRRALAFLILATLIVPMTASQINLQDKRGGFDFAGEWQPRHSLDIHDDWWDDWSRDANHDRIDDRLTWLLTQPEDFQSSWWKRADPGQARLFIDYDHHPSTADVRALEALGVSVTMRPIYLDSLIANVPIEMINPFSAILDLPGVVMMEDLGLAETHMNEAVPNMGVEEVWAQYGYDGTGVTIAVLDTGVRGDHAGLDDMDDEITLGCDQPDPDPFNPNPINIDCDPKISAFFDAVITDSEQPARESYDSGTHGSHVAGIAAGTGGGQEAPDGSRYVGVAPGAWIINILACCDGDIQDIIEGAEWAIENKEAKGIDILTSSLGEQQLEIHFDNDGSSAWSQQMDAVAASGIITFLSAGNEFGGATFAGCNTIDSPGDANLPITVASLDKDLGLAIYSSRGYTSDGRVKPDVSTIGSNIMAPDAATSDGYTSKSGTSMATPLMAGIAALMVEANPDITHDEVKSIISAHSIERDIQLLDDPGLNDCSLLETRPDNEFGYGQADPLLFVQSAGAIDSSLNVSMDLATLEKIGNESRISGTSTGGVPGVGYVQVKVGGGEWQQAADLSATNDWSSWNVKLLPHSESGNSTVYSRLVINEDRMSPVDARRVILIDGQAGTSSGAGGQTTLGPYVFLIPFLATVVLLGFTALREDWANTTTVKRKEEEKKTGGDPESSFVRNPMNGIRAFSLEMKHGGALTENKSRRMFTLCILYFAQGLPWGFASVTFAAYLVDNGVAIGDVAILFATVALPWTFKWIWGPVVDAVNIPRYGARRQWVLIAQLGMVLTLGTLLLVPDLNAEIELVTRLLFIHNIFASLQDVGTDALAVEILKPDEVAKANGFMFAAKRAGIIVGGAVLGVAVTKIGISGVIVIQLALLSAILIVPLTMVERPGVKLFPWSKSDDVWWAVEDEEGDKNAEDTEVQGPWLSEDRFRVAKSVGYTLDSRKITISAYLAVFGASVWVTGFAIDVFTIDFALGDRLRGLTNPIAYVALAASLALLGLSYTSFAHSLTSRTVTNPLSILPPSTRRGVAETSFFLTKAFSVRSAFLLIGLCLLSELYIFVGPIVIDIFINEAGWSQAKYNGIIGGVVVFGTLIGQIVGGLLGDRFGVRRVAMVGFTSLALANAGLAFLQSMWDNTPVMTVYLIIQAFVGGMAWICIISLSMRLTWSKVGGTQFTAYMSLFNLSGVFAYTLTERMISVFDYTSAIYIGAALTLITVFMLVFIDEDETDKVLGDSTPDETEVLGEGMPGALEIANDEATSVSV